MVVDAVGEVFYFARRLFLSKEFLEYTHFFLLIISYPLWTSTNNSVGTNQLIIHWSILSPVLVGAVVVIIAITIAIAVAITVMTAISATLCFGAVQYEGHVLELLLLVDLLYLRQHAALHQASTNHEDGAVGKLLVDWGIGYDFDWRTVDKYIVILCAQLLDHLLQQWSEQQLRWVWRDGTDWQDVEALYQSILLTLADDVVYIGDSAIQVIAQTFAWATCKHGGTSVTEVTVYQQDPFLLDGEGHRHIGIQMALT